MPEAVYITELSPTAIHNALEQAALSRQKATLSGPAGWRAPGTLAVPDSTGRLPFENPSGLLNALPMGTPVRVELELGIGKMNFHTQARGTDGGGRWLLDLPTVIQIMDRRAEARIEVSPGALSLEHPEHGTFEVVDLSAGGLAFRAPPEVVDKLAPQTRFALRGLDGECISTDLEVRNVRRAPGQALMRIVGTRFTCRSPALNTWYAAQAERRETSNA